MGLHIDSSPSRPEDCYSLVCGQPIWTLKFGITFRRQLGYLKLEATIFGEDGSGEDIAIGSEDALW